MSPSTNPQPHPRDDNWIPACFGPNQQKFPPEDLLPYAGKHIAWSWDGTRIVASGDSYSDVEAKVVALGVHPDRVVYDCIDPIWESSK